MWGKWNPCALLVGMQTDSATIENSEEIPQKIKNRTMDSDPEGSDPEGSDPESSFLGMCLKKIKTESQRNIYILMFIATLFTVAQIQK